METSSTKCCLRLDRVQPGLDSRGLSIVVTACEELAERAEPHRVGPRWLVSGTEEESVLVLALLLQVGRRKVLAPVVRGRLEARRELLGRGVVLRGGELEG